MKNSHPMPSSTLQAAKNVRIVLLATAVVLCVFTIGMIFFLRGKLLMEEQLDLRLSTAAATAALQFDAAELDEIQGEDYVNTAVLFAVAQRLGDIRNAVPNVRDAYILRRTENAQLLEFVADADVIHAPEQLDANGNGRIDPSEEPYYPGEQLDISRNLTLQGDAWLRPVIDHSAADAANRGRVTGYAPIRLANGETAAVLGLDMEASEYAVLTKSIATPLLLFLMALVAVLLGGYVGLFSWRRRAEIVQQIDNERALLMQMTSHQLATPLSTIKWWLEIAGEQIKDCGPCDQMQEAVEQMDIILRDLRMAQDIHRGSLAYRPRLTTLLSVVREVVKERTPRLNRHQHELSVDVPNDIQMPLDEMLLAGVLRELIDNAIDYAPDGTMITIKAEKKRSVILLSVIDLGCGISRQDMPRVFDKFTRGRSATRQKPLGTGLGLYIVKGTIELMGGKVGLVSEEGKGTTVVVTLPLA